MSESVHFYLEQMLPELEDLQERGIFNRVEVKQIVKARTNFEYAVHRRTQLKSDYLKYIQHEVNVEQLRRKRKLRLGLDIQGEKGTVSDFSIIKRIHGLYKRCLQRFGMDVDLWVQYFDFCKSIKSGNSLSQNFAKAIQLHPNKPIFWIMASKFEFEENNNVNSARILLQRSLRINPDSKKLWLEYFKLELLFCEKILERRSVLFDTKKIDHNDIDLDEDQHVNLPTLEEEKGLNKSDLEKDVSKVEAKNVDDKFSKSLKVLRSLEIPRIVYRQAIKAIPNDLQFRLDFLNIYTEYHKDSVAAREEIYESLLNDFPQNAKAMAAIAQKYLVEVSAVNNVTYIDLLKKCITEFNKFAEILKTDEIWDEFVFFLYKQSDICEDKNIKTYLDILIKKCFDTAVQLGNISENLILKKLEKENDLKEKEAILEAITFHPKHKNNNLLWKLRLKNFLSLNENKTVEWKNKAKKMFEICFKNLNKENLDKILNVYFTFLEISYQNKLLSERDIDSEFHRILQTFGLKKSQEADFVIKYLEYKLNNLTDCNTIHEIKLILNYKALDIKVYKHLLKIENLKEDLNLELLEFLYSCCLDLEKNLWNEYENFKIKRGDINGAAEIRWKKEKFSA
ncbi:U3 snoRNP protein [Clydaea vesicula]|uniref:U3 snoRNP protein n=1 Tax=Clydaea vesicula TaxID=447962 RepID=A0AAD5U5S1_9FUNG|nr:U3 snoRNP protein [Clydaea vesicula]